MAQHDYNIANASFPTVRTDINNVLSAINSSNSGSSRPSSAVAGTIWLDTSGAATAQLLKMQVEQQYLKHLILLQKGSKRSIKQIWHNTIIT